MNMFIIWELKDVSAQKHFIQKQINPSIYDEADQPHTHFFHMYQMELFFLNILYLFVYIHTSPPNTRTTDYRIRLVWLIFRITALMISYVCLIQ